MKMMKRLTAGVCVVFILVSFVMMGLPPAEAASGPSLTTTLTDNVIQRGSKKTFDVWARNAAGKKIKATVKLNGQKIEPTWDDTEKASYTLTFTKEGENIVTVSVSSDGGQKKELTYHITYKKANPGDPIGTAIWSIEMFTLGCGYLVYPVEVPIYEGENAAEQLIRLLHDNGFVGYYGGSLKASFYLAYLADGTAASENYNGYKKSGVPSEPRKLEIEPSIPEILSPHLEESMNFYDPSDYINNWEGYLGEFVISNGSGWMYSINNIFPNVGFADSYLSDGDVVRVQFTLGYGADIGGFSSMGSDIPGVDNQPSSGYFDVANKDQLTKSISKALSSGRLSERKVLEAYNRALTAITTLNSTQSAVNKAASELDKALSSAEENPKPSQPTTPTNPLPTQPKPTEPKPTEPKPTEPKPTKPQPTKPQPTEHHQTKPQPTVSEPTVPNPNQSRPSLPPMVPETTEPQPTEAKPTQPALTEPGVSIAPDGTLSGSVPGAVTENENNDHSAVIITVSVLGVILAAGIVVGVYFLRNKTDHQEGTKND